MKRAIRTLFAAVLAASAAVSCGSSLEIGELRPSLSGNAVEIPAREVCFGWMLNASEPGARQTAYEIRVSGNPGLSGHSDVWNSGKVLSGESRAVPYGGEPLQDGRTYWWTVRVWDAADRPSAWSAPERFSTALDPSDWEARWIGAIRRTEARLPEGNDYHTWGMSPEKAALWEQVDTLAKRSIMLRREFRAARPVAEAVVRICGLGHYDLRVNGREVDTTVFKPLWSEYGKTVYYNAFDLTDLLSEGPNALGVVLGNGMYNVCGGRYVKFRHSDGPPTLCMQLDITYTDGSRERILSDTAWRYALSPVTFNCIFGGEDYDARLEQPGWDLPGFDDAAWRDVVEQEPPKGTLTPQTAPAVAVCERYGVKEHRKTGPQRHLFDMGQNLSGFPTLKVRGRAGQKVRLVPAEQLSEDSLTVRQATSGSPCWFEYTLRGDSVEEWTPQFAFYGYRYLEAEGVDYLTAGSGGEVPVILDLQSDFVHASAPATGRFECSNALFNRIWFIIDKAMRSNMHAVFTDCPHREKLGWLEETHLNGPGLLFNYDLRGVLPKVMRDIADTQRPDGLIPDIAPEYVVFREGFVDSPEWGSAGAILPWMYYEWYGDDSLIREYYPVMRRYADYLAGRADNYILSYGLGDWCDYGPLPAGHSQNTPVEITATGHFYLVADCTARAAALVGDKAGAERYAVLARNIAGAFNTRLFTPETAQYGNGSQCSNAIPLFLGIVPAEYRQAVAGNLARAVDEKGGKLSTGDVGNRYLFQALARCGMNDRVYRMHNHGGVPGYGFQVAAGVTTLTEQWDPRLGLSWNHFMMGQIVEWFYNSLAGIRPDPGNPGFRHFFVEPAVVGDLEWVECSYRSVYGLIESCWKLDGDRFRIRVRVPVNTTATLVMPFGDPAPRLLASGVHEFEAPVPEDRRL